MRSYRLSIFVAIDSDDEPDTTVLEEIVGVIVEGLKDSDAYPDIATAAQQVHSVYFVGHGVVEHPDDVWSEHPRFPRSDWQGEVGNEDTNLGYWDWCAHHAEDDENAVSVAPDEFDGPLIKVDADGVGHHPDDPGYSAVVVP